jgi:hypothetical protein
MPKSAAELWDVVRDSLKLLASPDFTLEYEGDSEEESYQGIA